MDTSHESAHERLHTTTIALAPLKPDSAVALMQVRTGEPVGKKGRIPLFPHFVTREHNCNFSSLSPRFPPLPPTNLSRCSLEEDRGIECNKYPVAIDTEVCVFKKERKRERNLRRLPTTRRGERGIEATTPATHDAGGVGVSQIQIRSRCSRDTHPPCLRSDTRADLHARGRVASPRIAVVIDTFPLPFAPVSVKSRMPAIDIPNAVNYFVILSRNRRGSHAKMRFAFFFSPSLSWEERQIARRGLRKSWRKRGEMRRIWVSRRT